MRSKHNHKLVRQDENGRWYFALLCPDCEAEGVTLSDQDMRKGLLNVEKILRREGYTLTDVIDPASLPEVLRVLGR